MEDQTAAIVELIEDKRVVNESTEYFVKWKGCSRNENQWVTEENFDYPHLIAEYEKSIANKSVSKVEESPKEEGNNEKNLECYTAETIKSVLNVRDVNNCTGFDRGLEPEQILGATHICGVLLFLMKWKGRDTTELVVAKQANIKCPQVVIKFYEERLTWFEESTEDAQNNTTADGIVP